MSNSTSNRSPKLKCTIIGAGNVATHLAKALSEVVDVSEVFSRNIINAQKLAGEIGGRAIDDLSDISSDSDFYLISVVDDAIPWVIEQTRHIKTGIWAHTSGSTPMSIFNGEKNRFGVFYPLQTFSKDKSVEIQRVPLLIEGSSDEATQWLLNLAAEISNDVKVVDSIGRMRLHVAAVFACNFANFMWTQADEILKKSGLDIRVLTPLLNETLAKLQTLSPFEGQTGPARRGDFKVIEKHLGLLSNSHREIYQYLSDKIFETYHATGNISNPKIQ